MNKLIPSILYLFLYEHTKGNQALVFTEVYQRAACVHISMKICTPGALGPRGWWPQWSAKQAASI